MSEIIKGQVGDVAEHVVTKIRYEDGEPAAGNVVRRACTLMGKEACLQTCQLVERCGGNAEPFATIAAVSSTISSAKEKRACADLNLANAINKANLEPSEVLMVGVTDNEVGFGDKLEEYEADGRVKHNHLGWRELPGFNAFFARTDEVPALGRRLADCADINFEFKDSESNTVIGFEHGTRKNMFGESEYPFEREGKKVSYTEYAMGLAFDHYGADPASIKIKLAAAIKGHNFIKYFGSKEQMEGHIPGWYDAGYLKNVSNPDWQEGDPIVKTDAWEADSRGMIVDDIRKAMAAFGIPPENFSMEGIIDPADSKGVHSSHEFKDIYGDTRDLYLTHAPK